MKAQRIRPIAIAILRRGDDIWVFRAVDPATGKVFHRPLGGGIEFGEHSAACLAREMREELGAEITDLRYLGMLENVFVYDGATGHEFVVVYEARFVDPRWYHVEQFMAKDDDGELLVLWMPLSAFRAGQAILYPEGLLALIEPGGAA